MKKNQKHEEQSNLENAISYLLISGVLLSLILLIIGMVLLWRKQGGLAVSQDPSVFVHGHDFFSFIYQEVTHGGLKGLPLQLITLGVVVLLLTPYVRVILSVVYFARDRNLKYVLITIVVLIILTISLTLH
jgi:uncharacterized membrane protein